MAAHLGFVNGAVQCIVLLVVQQTEVQRPQRSCRETDRERESSSCSHMSSESTGKLTAPAPELYVGYIHTNIGTTRVTSRSQALKPLW